MLILEIVAGVFIAAKLLALDRAFEAWCAGSAPSFNAEDADDDADWRAMSPAERQAWLNRHGSY